VVPEGLEAVLDRGTWALPAAVRLMEEHGVPRTESERAFNCGVGMIAAVAPEAADAAVAQLTTAGVPAWVAGSIGRRTDGDAPPARLVGTYS
jgi:phosphoribosylformylglycinamidine cyclo-ligase